MKWKAVRIGAVLVLAVVALIVVTTPLVQRQFAALHVADLNLILQQLGEPYSQVQARRSTHPKAWLFGEVANHEEWQVLFREVQGQFGDAEAQRIMKNVRVREADADESA